MEINFTDTYNQMLPYCIHTSMQTWQRQLRSIEYNIEYKLGYITNLLQQVAIKMKCMSIFWLKGLLT